jgi:hypothetical protein
MLRYSPKGRKQVIHTDVLVIGCAVADLPTSVALARQGVNVAAITKHRSSESFQTLLTCTATSWPVSINSEAMDRRRLRCPAIGVEAIRIFIKPCILLSIGFLFAL